MMDGFCGANNSCFTLHAVAKSALPARTPAAITQPRFINLIMSYRPRRRSVFEIQANREDGRRARGEQIALRVTVVVVRFRVLARVVRPHVEIANPEHRARSGGVEQAAPDDVGQ